MRVAIIHDWLIVSGGAEKVTSALLQLYPEATVFSLIDFLNDADRQTILHGKKANTSFIQHLPMAKSLYRYYLPLFPKAIERLDMSGFDLIISSSYAVAKGVRKKFGQLHVCYCHTPMRYVWDMREAYLKSAGYSTGIQRWLVESMLNRLQKWDRKTADGVDHFIANSHHVAARIQRVYDRQAKVIYPPVDTARFTIGSEEREDIYLAVSRLVPYKKTDLIIRAFNARPDKQLVVIGDGPERKKLERLANKNVFILGQQTDAEVLEYLQRAKALILAAHEDFGITAIEAQACGTPVIALKKGGYLETVKASETGIFFEDQTVEDLLDAIENFESTGVSATSESIREHAISFDRSLFLQELTAFIKEKISG